MDKEQEDKVASLLAKAGLAHLCPAFLREKVSCTELGRVTWQMMM